jgi:hypothetical protein
VILLSLWLAPGSAQEQIVDANFDALVTTPAYASGGPTVAIDEAHGNFHTASGGAPKTIFAATPRSVTTLLVS